MRIHSVGETLKKQFGFTLIEVLVGVAICGLLAGGVTTAITQVFGVHASSSSRMVAIKQVESAIDAIRVDAIVAQQLTYNANGHVLNLRWVTWDLDETKTETHVVIYDLNSDNELIRTESITNAFDGSVSSITRVLARHIESITVDSYANSKIQLTIAASLEGFRSVTETRTFDILQRPAF